MIDLLKYSWSHCTRVESCNPFMVQCDQEYLSNIRDYM
jgi:hypothetical protein